MFTMFYTELYDNYLVIISKMDLGFIKDLQEKA